MIHNEEDSQYKQVSDILKQLPKVTAPLHFEADLMRKINAGAYEKPVKQSFWDTLLTPARLVPSAAVAFMAVILLVVSNTSKLDQDDPLSLEPRIREDLVQAQSQGISIEEQMKLAQKQGNLTIKENQRQENFTTISSINKAGLNFRQISLTPEEKQAISRLKERIKQYLAKQKPSNK